MVTCARCGAVGDGGEGSLPLGWSLATEDERVEYLCPACVRANIRSIEGKLPGEYWEH